MNRGNVCREDDMQEITEASMYKVILTFDKALSKVVYQLSWLQNMMSSLLCLRQFILSRGRFLLMLTILEFSVLLVRKRKSGYFTLPLY